MNGKEGKILVTEGRKCSSVDGHREGNHNRLGRQRWFQKPCKSKDAQPQKDGEGGTGCLGTMVANAQSTDTTSVSSTSPP